MKMDSAIVWNVFCYYLDFHVTKVVNLQCHIRFDLLSKLSYIFKEKKLNKSLAKCMMSMCKFEHFHFSTKPYSFVG